MANPVRSNHLEDSVHNAHAEPTDADVIYMSAKRIPVLLLCDAGHQVL